MAFAARSSVSLRSSACLPRSTARRCVSVRAAADGKAWLQTQPGVTAPFGFFDPSGFTEGDNFTVGEAKRYRESEVTHGRVAMLAAAGWLVQEQVHPLFGGDIVGPAVVHFQKVEAIWPQFWELVLFSIGLFESLRIAKAYNTPGSADVIKSTHNPGEIGFDPLGFYPKDAAGRKEIQSKEINNGRLAMLAVAGFAGQEAKNHVTIFESFSGADASSVPLL